MKIIGVFVVLFFAMVEDVQERKIRNVWVLCVFLLSLILAWEGDLWGPLIYLGRALLWFIGLLFFYKFGEIGAGDVKLISVLVAGVKDSWQFMFWMSTLLCAVVLVLRKKRGERCQSIPLALPLWFGYATLCLFKGGVSV